MMFTQLRALPQRIVHRATASTEELVGTVASHTSYILLHTRVPPHSFPGKVPSKLQRTLQLHASRWGGLVNLVWTPHSDTSSSVDAIPEWSMGEGERYSAVAFSAYNSALDVPEINLQNVESVAAKLRKHASPPGAETLSRSVGSAKQQDEVIHLYVCTHGQRDCRCGDTGGAVFDALCEEVQRRSLQQIVKVGGVGHVGGHKYAANVLVFPYGEWLGHLTPSHVPEVLESIMSLREASASRPFSVTSTPPLCPSFWRGRMGLDKEEQLQLLRPSTAQPVDELKPLSRL
ncbi:Sucrase/ferredoxin-like-domain-containing protein [Cytidiella melzeri]|nr:Sucrase/ferredoxin-like-domain-containing protein [Cytidiella melzeri]